MLDLYTAFKLTTAQQRCLERNRDTPNAQDLSDAVKLRAGWNMQRMKGGLRPWS